MIIKVLLKWSHFTLESSKGLCFKDGVQDGCHNFSYSPFYELMMQLKYGVFPLSFQVYTPRSLVALAVKEVAKVYRFYDQDAFSFVRNIDYYPLTITDLAPPEFHVTDDSKINLLQEEKMERMLLSAKKFLMKRRRAVNAIFDTIAKMIVNFRNKEEVDELDLKRLRVKTVKYLGIMDLLDSVGIEVELEDMLEEMISHIQQHRFRAKLLNLFLNQSYLGCGEKVEDVDPTGGSEGDNTKIAGAEEESNKQKGEKKIGDGQVANEMKDKEVVQEDRTENEKVVDTDLVVRDNVDSAEDWIIVESGDIIASAAGHQEVNGERTEKETEKTDLAFRCEIESTEDTVVRKHVDITDGLKEKVIEGVEKTDLAVKNDNESVDNEAVSAIESSTSYHQKQEANEEKETIKSEISSGSSAVKDSENSAGGTAGIGGCSIDDSSNQQKELNEERAEMEEFIDNKLKSEKEDIKDDHTDNVENTMQAFEIGDIVEPSEDEVKREDGDIIDDHQGAINQGKNEEEIEKVEDVKETLCDQASTITIIECPIANNENQDRVGNENSEACRALEDVIEPAGDGASIADRQNEGSNVIVKNEGEKTELAVGEIVESAGDCPGDILVNIDNMEKETDKEIKLSEIKVTVEKEETGLAVGNKGCPCGDGVKIGDKPDKDSQEQLGCTDENRGEVNGEMKLVVKEERFCINDEKYSVFVLYGMVRCSEE